MSEITSTRRLQQLTIHPENNKEQAQIAAELLENRKHLRTIRTMLKTMSDNESNYQQRITELEGKLLRANELGDGLAECLILKTNVRRAVANDRLVNLWKEYRARIQQDGEG